MARGYRDLNALNDAPPPEPEAPNEESGDDLPPLADAVSRAVEADSTGTVLGMLVGAVLRALG